MVASLQRRLFWWRVGIAFRTGFSALLCAAFILTSRISSWMASPFFAEVLAVLICDGTLGRTIRNLYSTAWGVLESVVVAIICRQVFVPSYGPMLVCMTVSSFIFAYPNVPLLTKKVALALNGLLYFGFMLEKNRNVIYALQLGGTTMFGGFCAVVAMLLPFPQLAQVEVLDRSVFSGRCFTTLFAMLTEAYCSEGGEVEKVGSTHVEILAQSAAVNLADMKERILDLHWEPGGGRFLPVTECLVSSFPNLLMHCAGMQATLKTGCTLPPLMLLSLRDQLRKLTNISASAILVTTETLSRNFSKQQREEVLKAGLKGLEEFNLVFLRARELLVDNFSQTSVESEPGVQFLGEEKNSTDNKRRSDLAFCFFLFNAEAYVKEVLHLLEKINRIHKKSFFSCEIPSIFSFKLPWWRENTSPNPYPSAQADEFTNENDSEEGVCVNEEIPISVSVNQSQIITSLRCGRHSERGRERGTRSQTTNNGTHGNLLQTFWTFFLRFWKNRAKQILFAFKVSIAVLLAGVIGTAFDRDFSFWAVVTVGFIIGGNQGGAFRTANLRLQGTVAGSIYGYLAIVVTQHHPWLLLLPLVPWVILTSYMRYDSRHGYSGIVAAFTAAIIMIGYSYSEQEVEDYALDRITQTFVGVLCFVIVEGLIFPARAVLLVRSALLQSFNDIRDCITISIEAYSRQDCVDCHTKVKPILDSLQKNISGSIGKQAVLVGEAEQEPELWRAPFPVSLYNQIQGIITRMLRLLFIIDSVLSTSRLPEVSEQNRQAEKLLLPLHSPLLAMKVELETSLNNLINVLRSSWENRGSWKKTQRSGNSEREEGGEREEREEGEDEEEGGNQHRPVRNSRETSINPSSTSSLTDRRNKREGNPRREYNYNSLTSFNMREILPKQIHQHPLLLIESRVKAVEEGKGPLLAFETRYQEVMESLKAIKKNNPDAHMVGNSAMLSFGALVFAVSSLLRETVILETKVRELLQIENPLDLRQLTFMYFDLNKPMYRIMESRIESFSLYGNATPREKSLDREVDGELEGEREGEREGDREGEIEAVPVKLDSLKEIV